MRLLILWLGIVTFLPFTGIGQMLDSIKYKYGYLYYHVYGQGEPIIVLSGGPGGSYLQVEEMAIATSIKFRSVLLEQRGTGRSIPVPFDSTTINLQAALQDLNLLLLRLGIRRATFLGHSWGAMLAMSFAAAFHAKVKALILVSPGPYKEWQKNAQILQMSWKSKMGREEQQIFDSVNRKIASGLADAADSQTGRKLILETYHFDKSLSDCIQKESRAYQIYRCGI